MSCTYQPWKNTHRLILNESTESLETRRQMRSRCGETFRPMGKVHISRRRHSPQHKLQLDFTRCSFEYADLL